MSWNAGGSAGWNGDGDAGASLGGSSGWDDGGKAHNGGGFGDGAADAGDLPKDNGGDGPIGGDGDVRACYNCGQPGYVVMKVRSRFIQVASI